MYSELLKYKKTYGPLEGDFYEWHKGRPKYAVWVLEPSNNEQFFERYYAAQKHLSKYLINDYQRKPHITLAPCGFLVSERKLVDDYSPDLLQQDIDQILKLPITSVDVVIKNILISYAIAPGFKVIDQYGSLKMLNDLLGKKDHYAKNYQYFPHVTVGLYNNEWETSLILDELMSFAIQEDILLTFDTLKLVSYIPIVSGGALEDELIINLSNKTVTECSKIF